MEASPARLAGKRKDGDAVAAADPAADAGSGTKLLAGYLTHEFLACGTVLGDRLATGVENPGSETGRGRAARYEAMAVLVQGGGARVPVVVNSSKLAAWGVK